MKLASLIKAEGSAADLVGLNKEAGAWDDLKERFKNTDARVWSTPTGMVAGLALTHLLSSKGNRTKGRYIAGGGLGALGGLGLGMGIERAKAQDTKVERAKRMFEELEGQYGDRFRYTPKDGNVADNLEELDNYITKFFYDNPQALSEDRFNKDLDRIIAIQKATKLKTGESVWEKELRDWKLWPHLKNDWHASLRAGRKGMPFTSQIPSPQAWREKRDRFVLRHRLADMVAKLYEGHEAEKAALKHVVAAKTKNRPWDDKLVNWKAILGMIPGVDGE